MGNNNSDVATELMLGTVRPSPSPITFPTAHHQLGGLL